MPPTALSVPISRLLTRFQEEKERKPVFSERAMDRENKRSRKKHKTQKKQKTRARAWGLNIPQTRRQLGNAQSGFVATSVLVSLHDDHQGHRTGVIDCSLGTVVYKTQTGIIGSHLSGHDPATERRRSRLVS